MNKDTSGLEECPYCGTTREEYRESHSSELFCVYILDEDTHDIAYFTDDNRIVAAPGSGERESFVGLWCFSCDEQFDPREYGWEIELPY